MRKTFLGVLLICAYSITAQAITTTFQQSATYSRTKDTFLTKDKTPDPNIPNGDLGEVIVDYVYRDDALLRFDDIFGYEDWQIRLDLIQEADDITQATLKVRNKDSSAACGANVYRVLQDWDEASATWDNSFGGDGIDADDNEAISVYDDYTDGPDQGWVTFNVTNSIKEWYKDEGATNYGWALLYRHEHNDGWRFYSRESTDESYRPILEVQYVPEPATVLLLGLGGAMLGRKRH